MHLGMGEMLIVLVIALLVFGPNKLPQLGDALGKGIRNFKAAANHDGDSVDVKRGKTEPTELSAALSTPAGSAKAEPTKSA